MKEVRILRECIIKMKGVGEMDINKRSISIRRMDELYTKD